MGILEVVMLSVLGCMEVLDTDLGMLMVPGSWSLQMGKTWSVYNTMFTTQESIQAGDMWLAL